MLNADFQQQCERLHRRAQQAWGRQFLGRRRRLRVAGGTEETGVVDYTSGAELRYVDWNRCARHDELVTRQYMGTEDHATYFLLDNSRSMAFADGAKFDLARQLTAALAFLAIANHDRVWLGTFAGGLDAEFPQSRGRQTIPALFEFLSQQSAGGETTRLEQAVDQFTQRQMQRGLVVILSDMFDAGRFDVAIDVLRMQGYEPLLIHVLSDKEAEPQLNGKVSLEAVEDGHRRAMTIDVQDQRNYAVEFERNCRRVRGYFHRYGLGVAGVSTADSLTQCLERIVLGSALRRHTRAGIR